MGMSVYDHALRALDGSSLDLTQFTGKVTLVVNVASRCGLTPQYTGLEQLHERFRERGFSVLGVPCNQFGLDGLDHLIGLGGRLGAKAGNDVAFGRYQEFLEVPLDVAPDYLEAERQPCLNLC